MATDRLTALKVKGKLEPGWHGDGNNLFLRVRKASGTRASTRSWVYRYKVGGKVVELGLGSPSDYDLKSVRELAKAMRGNPNPAEVLKAARTKVVPSQPDTAPTAKTFRVSAKELIALRTRGFRNPKHIAQWTTTLETYAFPVIGDLMPADIKLAHIVAVLQPIWHTKTETATRVRQRIEAVLDYAIADEDSERSNPARWRGKLSDRLPDPRQKGMKHVHRAAAPHAEVPAIMAALKAKDHTSAHCLRFNILTASRPGEVRGALWSEIDLEAKAWRIPAERMKANRPHRVPLSDEAIEILKVMQTRKVPGTDRVFPGGNGGLLSDVAVNKTLHAIKPGITVHGFRSSFRDWGAEATSFPRAALELALAHVNNDKTEAAYFHSDMFEVRKKLMSSWAKYCAKVDNVRLLKSA